MLGFKLALTGAEHHVIGNQLQQAGWLKGPAGMFENLIVFIIVILAMALVLRRALGVFRRKDVTCGCESGCSCVKGAAPEEGTGAVKDRTSSHPRGAVM